jgi:hypothetical protein
MLLVDTADLLAGDLSTQEKAVLSQWPKGVPMSPLVEMYSARVVSFYKWLAGRIPYWYSDADEELGMLSRDFQRSLEEAGLGDLPSLFDRLSSRRGDSSEQ